MPNTDETYEHTCTGNWDPVAGAGRVFIENLNAANVLSWAIAGPSEPTLTRGYSLPLANGARSGAEGISVPAGKVLWVRGDVGQMACVTVETLP